MLKKEVLRRKDDFTAIYRKGRSIGERYIVFFYRKNDLSYNRTAFLASKKVGNSIVRHRLTRLIRESYRLQEERFRCGLDIIVIARIGAKGKDYKDIVGAMLHLGHLHKIIDEG
mgnify:CR=1 FL=1